MVGRTIWQHPWRLGLGALLLFAAAAAGEGPGAGAGCIDLGALAPPLPEIGWMGKQATRPSLAGKLAILYFFQPGCGSCDAFTLHLNRLQRRHGKDFVAVGIADRPDKDLKELATGINRVYHVLKDPGHVYSRRFLGKIDVLPAYALVDRSGRVVWVDQGQYRLPFILELERQLAGSKTHKPIDGGLCRGLVVGVRQDLLTGKTLSRPHHDAEAFGAALHRNGCAEVRVLTDGSSSPPTDQPTPARIRTILQTWAGEARAADRIVFCFTGSGLQYGKGVDMDFDLLMGTPETQQSLSLRALGTVLGRARCPTLILLDIGHEDGGAAAYGSLTGTIDRLFPKTTIFFSCSGRNGQTRGLPAACKTASTRFMHFAIQALSGPGDSNHDGCVTAPELFRYIWLHLNDLNRRLDTKQVPFAAGLERERQVVFPVPRSRIQHSTR